MMLFMGEKAAKVLIGVRLDESHVKELERLGSEAKPVAANRSEMIAAAVAEYIERHGRPKKREK